MAAENAAGTGDGSALDANAVKVFLMASSEDLEAVWVTFKALVGKVGYVADGVPAKGDLLDRVGYEDMIRMMCEYAANFIVPSLFSEGGDGK